MRFAYSCNETDKLSIKIKIRIPAFLATKDDEKYPALKTVKIKRKRNRRFRTRPRDIGILYYTVYRLNNLICLRYKRYLKLYGRR
jgi:hypothetical protein